MSTHRDTAIRVLTALRDAGHTAYFAGGAVRDELLGLVPTDYDIATDARPDAVAALFKNTNEVGASFGVMLVRLAGCAIEVATFREEGAYSDRRRPDAVRYADAPSDARRRDFTINALFLDPLDQSPPTANAADSSFTGGKIIDYVGGVDDLHRRIIRAVGDPEQRLAEDHLRALRAVRFAARLGFTIEDATARAIRQHANELAGVSRERIGDEIQRMLVNPNRADAIALLDELELDRVVLNESNTGDQHPLRARTAHASARSDVRAARVRIVGSLPPAASYPLALAAWAVQRALNAAAVDSADTDTIAAIASPLRAVPKNWRRALCLSNDDHTRLAGVLAAAVRLSSHWETLGVAPRKHLAADAGFDDALTLLALVQPALANRVASDLTSLQNDSVGIHPQPFLTGDDLIRLGAVPGPALGAILRNLYDRQLEGALCSKKDAKKYARALLASPPDPPGQPADHPKK